MVKPLCISHANIGLPLKKMKPMNEEDLLFKINQKFNSVKDILNFYENNRDLI